MSQPCIIVQLKVEEDAGENSNDERVILVSRTLFESLSPNGVLVARDVVNGGYQSVRKKEVVFVREEMH